MTMQRAGVSKLWAVTTGAFLLGPLAWSQVSLEVRPRAASAVSAGPAAHLRIDQDLVLVPVTVSDSGDRLITGLDKDRFRVFDDKVEQTVTQFAMEDEPTAIGLVFDVSGSMRSKLRRSRAAAQAFLETANPDDEFFLVTFNDGPRLEVPLTGDPGQIQTHLAFTSSHGNTALLDALYLAVNEIKKSTKPRKALLVISDGGDNASRFTEYEVRSLVREADVLIYGIGIYDSFGSHGQSAEEIYGPTLLGEIAGQTGGREFAVDDLRDLPDTASKIGIELRNRYVLGFSPTDQRRDGRYHHVQVKVVQPRGMPKLQAHWRQGYFAPGE